MLAAKDVEWYEKNFPDAGEETADEEEGKEATETEPPTKKIRRNKVDSYFPFSITLPSTTQKLVKLVSLHDSQFSFWTFFEQDF